MKFKGIIFCFLIFFSSNTWAQATNYNFVQCLFEQYNGQWDIGFSSHLASPFNVQEGEAHSLGSIWWKNGTNATYAESALCTHMPTVYKNGEVEITSSIHNGDYFDDVDSLTCDWIGEGIVPQLSKSKRMGHGENLIYEFNRPTPTKNKIRIVSYLPTPQEIKNLNPDTTEAICLKFHP